MPITRKRPTLPTNATATDSEVSKFRQNFLHGESFPPANLAVELPLSQITPSILNPRKTFDQAELESLAKSIKSVGVQQAICVRPLPLSPHFRDSRSGEPAQQYELIFGERRYRASKLAGKPTIPARIVDVTDEEALDLQARENLDRVDLNPIERAITFAQLLEKCHLTQEALAARYKISQAEISNAVRLLDLPPEWQEFVSAGQLSPTHARELLPWCDLPAVLEKLLPKESGDVDFGSAREWKETIRGWLLTCSKPMKPPAWPGDSNGCRFRATKPADVEALKIREVPVWNGTEKRAFNVEEWSRRQKAAKARAAEKPAKETNESVSHAPKANDWERRNFLSTVWNYKITWIRCRVGRKATEMVTEGLATETQRHLLWCLGALLLRCDCEVDCWSFSAKNHRRLGAEELAKYPRDEIDRRLIEGAVTFLSANELTRWDIEGEESGILALAGALDVDLLRDWRPEQEFVELFDAARRTEFLLPGIKNQAAIQDAKLSTAVFLENWPTIPTVWIPDVLRLVDERGELVASKAKPSAKKKVKQHG